MRKQILRSSELSLNARSLRAWPSLLYAAVAFAVRTPKVIAHSLLLVHQKRKERASLIAQGVREGRMLELGVSVGIQKSTGIQSVCKPCVQDHQEEGKRTRA